MSQANQSYSPFLASLSNHSSSFTSPFASSATSGDPPQPPPSPPPPAVEVPFSFEDSLYRKPTIETMTFNGGLTLLKCRVSTSDVFGLSNSDLVPGKYEGGLKLWEGSLDLVKALHSEIQDGQLLLDGKKVLELGCGHGLPGIFTCLKGAAAVHFQDFNLEVLHHLTVPNIRINLKKQRDVMESNPDANKGKSRTSEIRLFAGDWSEMHKLLFQSRRSEPEHDGYDVILMAETVYSTSSLQTLYKLIKKSLRWPSGVVYLAAKKCYFGVGGGTRQFVSVVENDGAMVANLVAEIADGASNVREIWKFSLKQDCSVNHQKVQF